MIICRGRNPLGPLQQTSYLKTYFFNKLDLATREDIINNKQRVSITANFFKTYFFKQSGHCIGNVDKRVDRI